MQRGSVKKLGKGPVDKKKSEKALSVIIPTLGEHPLQPIQNCDTAKADWGTLQHRYAGKTIAIKSGALSNPLNSKYKNFTNVRDHFADLKSQINCLFAMGSPFKDSSKVAILLSSLSSYREFSATIASINTLKENLATWDWIPNIFIE